MRPPLDGGHEALDDVPEVVVYLGIRRKTWWFNSEVQESMSRKRLERERETDFNIYKDQ